jgi:hypothetical protein
VGFSVDGFVCFAGAVSEISTHIDDVGGRLAFGKELLDEACSFSMGEGGEDCGLAF